MQIALKNGQKGASLSGFDDEFVVVLSHEVISLRTVLMHNQRSKFQCYPTFAYLKSFSSLYGERKSLYFILKPVSKTCMKLDVMELVLSFS